MTDTVPDYAKLIARLNRLTTNSWGDQDGHRNPDGPEAADAITALQDKIRRLEGATSASLDNWQALVRIIGSCITENDEPDRVRWEGVWHEGPLATAYLKTMRAIEEMARRNVVALNGSPDQ